MADSPNLVLPYIEAAQAQKHVTHNEAIRALDALVQLSVLDRDLASPPASPVDGARYIVAASPTGAWSGFAGKIAAYQDGAWMFYTPREGWIAWIADENVGLVYDGAAWITFGGGGGTTSVNPVTGGLLGVNTTADTTNRLAVKSDATLFSHDDVTPGSGDIRAKLNKSAANKTASVLFQDAFSGRAEIGLTGDDDFHFKVSSDGAAFKEAILIDRTSGRVTLPSTSASNSNLFTDSGRFAAASASVTVGAFAAPAYLVPYNGATLTGHGKFIFNNTDYGGSGGTMNADVKGLIDKIRAADRRRWGVEFWVAALTKGAATAGAISAGGTTYYETLFQAQTPRLPVATVHLYLRAKTGNVVVRNDGQDIFLDGVKQTAGAHAVITPAMGWQAVRLVDRIPPYNSFGYTPAHFDLYQAAQNDVALIALPSLMQGDIVIDPNIGIIPSFNLWSA